MGRGLHEKVREDIFQLLSGFRKGEFIHPLSLGRSLNGHDIRTITDHMRWLAQKGQSFEEGRKLKQIPKSYPGFYMDPENDDTAILIEKLRSEEAPIEETRAALTIMGLFNLSKKIGIDRCLHIFGEIKAKSNPMLGFLFLLFAGWTGEDPYHTLGKMHLQEILSN